MRRNNNKNTNLLLILPKSKRGHGSAKNEPGKFGIAPFSLVHLAALTPYEYNISIIDENVEKIDFTQPADLVGIHVITMTAPQAYEIAHKFRSNGTTVVFGGIHPTVIPEESLQHADAIVLGEAENVWKNLLKDHQRGELKKIYQSQNYCSLKDLLQPRFDLLKPNAYFMTNLVETKRGCPEIFMRGTDCYAPDTLS